MKRSEFFNFVNTNFSDKPFELIYKKINGEMRIAKGKLRNPETDKNLKGTGMNRFRKMENADVFQYFDIERNAYRSALLENIRSIGIIENEKMKIILED
jgi:hypothetical protein